MKISSILVAFLENMNFTASAAVAFGRVDEGRWQITGDCKFSHVLLFLSYLILIIIAMDTQR